MTVDLSEVKAFNSSAQTKCYVCRVLQDGLDVEVRQILEAGLADKSIEGKALSNWLFATHGIKVGYWSINRHRRGECNHDR